MTNPQLRPLFPLQSKGANGHGLHTTEEDLRSSFVSNNFKSVSCLNSNEMATRINAIPSVHIDIHNYPPRAPLPSAKKTFVIFRSRPMIVLTGSQARKYPISHTTPEEQIMRRQYHLSEHSAQVCMAEGILENKT